MSRRGPVPGKVGYVALVLVAWAGQAAGQVDLLANGGFESGASVGWSESSTQGVDNVQNRVDLARTGWWLAWMGGADDDVGQLWQSAVIPTHGTAMLRFYLSVVTREFDGARHDVLTVAMDSRPILDVDNTAATGDDPDYQLQEIDLGSRADGQSHELRFISWCDDRINTWTNFYIDDVSLVWTPDDPDPGTPPVVQFSNAEADGVEGNASVALNVEVDKPSTSVVTVDYAVTGGAALAIADYTLAAGTLTFELGELLKPITLDVVNDALVEVDETIEISLSNPSGATLGANGVLTYTIVDDDAEPAVQFDLAASEGPEWLTPATIVLELDRPYSGPVTVDYATGGGSATATVDYQPASGTLEFEPGQTTGTIGVFIVDDREVETNETFNLTLSNPANATLGGNTTHTFTIVENDIAPPPPGLCGTMSPLAPLGALCGLLTLRGARRRRL